MENISSNIVEKVKQPKDPKKVVDFVVSQWKKLQENRQSQVDLATELKEWAAMNQEPMTIYNTKQDPIKGFKDNKLATVVEVMTAQVGNQSWSNVSQLFDVRSIETVTPPTQDQFSNYMEFLQATQQFEMIMQDEEAKKQIIEQGEKKADLQKKALDQALTKMKANIQFEKCFTQGDLFYGEKISKIGWKQKTIVQKLYGGKENKIDYDNADIQAIDPISFVFDTVKYVKDDMDNFKEIIKIHKRFETIESITSRKYTNQMGQVVPLYKLSKEDIQELKGSNESSTDTTDPQTDDQKIQETKVGDSYATYFVHGDFKIDGVEYKNYIAEVFADKFLIRFEPNPIYICPFIIKMDEQDPKTKRGIARLKSILDSCKMRQDYINLKQQKDFLNGNPPTAMTDKMKEAFVKPGENKFQWKPGMIIKIDELLQNAINNIKQFFFDTKGDIDNISFITAEISDNGAVNANAMGNIDTKTDVATNLKLAKEGQDIRTQKILDSIYEFALENIKAVAQILALFKSGVEVFKVKNKNVEELIAITDIIRQGQYEYTYEDRNALMNRHAKLEQAIQLIESLSNVPEMAQKFDYVECFRAGMETLEFDTPEKFLKSETTIDSVIAEFQSLQPEEQQQIIQMITQQQQQAQMQQQSQEVKDWNLQQRYGKMQMEKAQIADNPMAQQMSENMTALNE